MNQSECEELWATYDPNINDYPLRLVRLPMTSDFNHYMLDTVQDGVKFRVDFSLRGNFSQHEYEYEIERAMTKMKAKLESHRAASRRENFLLLPRPRPGLNVGAAL